MEVILHIDDIKRDSRGISPRALQLSDFACRLEIFYNARKITFVHGKEKIILKDVDRDYSRPRERPLRIDRWDDLLSERPPTISG